MINSDYDVADALFLSVPGKQDCIRPQAKALFITQGQIRQNAISFANLLLLPMYASPSSMFQSFRFQCRTLSAIQTDDQRRKRTAINSTAAISRMITGADRIRSRLPVSIKASACTVTENYMKLQALTAQHFYVPPPADFAQDRNAPEKCMSIIAAIPT